MHSGEAILWDLATQLEIRHFKGHLAQVLGAKFSNDGNHIATISADGSVRIWDTGSGDELVALYVLDDDDWVAVTPDGRYDGSAKGVESLLFRREGTSELRQAPAEKRVLRLLSKLARAPG